MVFAANIFLYLFLPLFLGAYYLTPARWRGLLVAVFSYAFYGWWRPDFVILLWVSTVLDFFVGGRIVNARARGASPHGWLLLSVCTNLGLLCYFKYANWGVESLNAVLVASGAEPIVWSHIVLPIGISFYTFQTMSYTIDLYRGAAPPVKGFTDFACYVALFPQLVAGPIVRYGTIAEELASRTHSFPKFSVGAMRFMIGFCKKVLVADTVAGLVNASFALPDPTAADAWLGALAYTVQLYYDFSGYSDMAIGLGLMIGFEFPENFDHPYISRSITEFWRRWHISLSSWLRDYLYVSLGGNRYGLSRTYVNLGLTMLLGGVWHGANWTFVIWGIWHGGLLALERHRTRRHGAHRVAPHQPPGVTLLLVILGWVIFRATDLKSALAMYRGMAGFNGLGLSDAMAWQVTPWAVIMVGVGFVLAFFAPWWRDRVVSTPEPARARLAAAHLVFVPLFVLGALRLSAQSYTPFLYFQF